MPRAKALISWSSGKDAAFALHEVLRAGQFEVVGALTTVTETFGRVSIHGVRQEILQAQCKAAGLRQRIVPIPYPCPNEIYEARMGEAVGERAETVMIESWHDHPPFLDLIAERIRGTDAHVVFTAHSLPERILAEGDPYKDQLLETSRLVAERAGVANWSFAFQSASPTGEPWLGPDILDELERYNRTDCESTWRLREWLEDRRSDAEAQYGAPAPRPLKPEEAPPELISPARPM